MAVPGRVANAGSDSNGGSGSYSCETPTKPTAAERIAEFSGGFSKLPTQKSSGNPREILVKSSRNPAAEQGLTGKHNYILFYNCANNNVERK
jgi:hypothetical protein